LRSAPLSVARVVLVPSPGQLGPLDYRVPAPLIAVPGTRVLVPLGQRRHMGVVIEMRADSDTPSLRDVIAVLDEAPILAAPMLELLSWMATYYAAPFGETLSTALPGVLRIETERTAALAAEAPADARLSDLERALVAELRGVPPVAVAQLVKRHGDRAPAALRRLQRAGIVHLGERLQREVAPTRHVALYRATQDAPVDDPRLARRPALRALYEYLRDHPRGEAATAELRASFPGAAAKLRALLDLGLVRRRDEEEYRSVLPRHRPRDRAVDLNPAQRDAVEALCAAQPRGFAPFLLWGVTGSGKTEVYLHSISATLASGRSALILVPEISLTHQLVDRVRARFGDALAVLHSGLSAAERWDQFRRIARGEARIAIGARSAVFAPLPELGIIVVDEEHDTAYKQSDGVHYHARDVAVMRAKIEGCVLVLGSATPSLESHGNAGEGRYQLLTLPERVENRPLPEVTVVDLRGRHMTSPLGEELAAAISANLSAGGQTLLFLNRRGFANFLQCNACGEPIRCPNCSVSLTWHERPPALHCHHCGHTLRRPERCAECGEPALQIWGWGTERLEALLRESFPAARIGRLDRDTTRRKGSMEEILAAWRGGRIDILIGTQMIAKGHDVTGVTLVGVVFADLSLNLPDFRGCERTFQLLAQVAGRAGRGNRRGRVFVQTLQPEHFALQAALRHDFADFAARELEARHELGYPPFSRLLLLRVEGADEEQVRRAVGTIAGELRRGSGPGVAVLGPAAAPLERLRGRHRRQILLRGRSAAALRAAAQRVLGARPRRRGDDLRVIIDVDPQSLL